MKHTLLTETYKTTILQCSLFQNIPADRLDEVITFLHGFVKTYKKNDLIISLDDPFTHAGIVLSGKVEVSYTALKINSLSFLYQQPF